MLGPGSPRVGHWFPSHPLTLAVAPGGLGGLWGAEEIPPFVEKWGERAREPAKDKCPHLFISFQVTAEILALHCLAIIYLYTTLHLLVN